MEDEVKVYCLADGKDEKHEVKRVKYCGLEVANKGGATIQEWIPERYEAVSQVREGEIA